MKKIRVKSTGNIYIVPDYVTISVEECNSYGTPLSFSLDEIEILDEDNTALSREQGTLDYWTRLEHQAAIAAMQGLVTRGEVRGLSVQGIARDIAEISCEIAHALVEKYKKEEK